MIDQLYSDYSNMSCAHIGADSKWFLLGNEGSDLPQRAPVEMQVADQQMWIEWNQSKDLKQSTNRHFAHYTWLDAFHFIEYHANTH